MRGVNSRPPRAWRFAAVFGPLLIAGALYANALDNPYISDDGKIVQENVGLRHPSARVLRAIWSSHYWMLIGAAGQTRPFGNDANLYRPFTVTSYLINEIPVAFAAGSAAADNPRTDRIRRIAYRSVNVLLHAAAALLIGWWCAMRFGTVSGAAAALLVVVHPVATDVINRLVGRADILVLLGASGVLLVQHAANVAGWTWRSVLGVGALTGVALFSKESGLIVPVLAATQHWLHARTAGKPRTSGRGLGAIAAVTALYLMARFAVVDAPEYLVDQAGDLLANPVIGEPWTVRVPVFLALCWHYVRALLVPWPLLAFDVPATLPGWGDWQVYAGICVIAAGVVAAVRMGRRHDPAAIALIWLALNLLVIGQLLMPIGVYTETRVAYTMLGALAILVAWGVGKLPAAMSVRMAVATVAGVALIAACWLTLTRNRDYRSELELLAADVRIRPHSAAATLRLGNGYVKAGNLSEAERYLRLTTSLAPASSQAWYDYGTFLARQRQDYPGALQAFERARAANPLNVLALLNGSAAALSMGNVPYAWKLLTEARRIDPGNIQVEYNMAMVELSRGDTGAALARLQDIRRRDPGNANVNAMIARIMGARRSCTVRLEQDTTNRSVRLSRTGVVGTSKRSEKAPRRRQQSGRSRRVSRAIRARDPLGLRET